MKILLNHKQFYNRLANLPTERIFWILSIVLIACSLTYLSKGFYHLLFLNDSGAVKDLWSRWQEQQYIARGSYPYYARLGTSHVIEELGAVQSGGYPPWAFFTGVFLVPPNFSWQMIRFYFGLTNALSLLILALFSYQVVFPCSPTKSLFAVASTLAISSNYATLSLGQYGLIVNAFLIGVYWLFEQKKFSWAGLCFGLAMLKPNISALYLFIFLIKRKFKAIFVCFMYLAFASSFIWIATKVNPVEMIVEIFRQFDYYALTGTSLVNVLPFHLKLTPTSFVVIFGSLGIAIVLLLFYYFRKTSLLTLFAIACVAGRVFTYHRIYDNVMLIFLLLAFLRMIYENSNILNLSIFFLLGLSLWLPGRVSLLADPWWTSFQITIWITALIYLLIHEYSPKRDVLLNRRLI